MRGEVIYNLDTRSYSSRHGICTECVWQSGGKSARGKVVVQHVKME